MKNVEKKLRDMRIEWDDLTHIKHKDQINPNKKIKRNQEKAKSSKKIKERKHVSFLILCVNLNKLWCPVV